MIEVAKKAAYAAGKILIENFRNLPKEAIRQKSRNDFLSFVDESSEKTIISMIHEKYPDHSILAEEGGASDRSTEYRWIIDPLDGTTNYITNIPIFCVSIALQKTDEIILGVIYDPIHDELFWAEKGKGAFINENPIKVSEAKNLSESFIATGFPFKAKKFIPNYLDSFEQIFSKCIGKRRMGSAAIDLAYVAAGRFDGFWELGLSPWDLAAGSIIIKEAGGKLTDFWNGSNYLNNNYLIATNGKIHRELSDIIQSHFPIYKDVYSK